MPEKTQKDTPRQLSFIWLPLYSIRGGLTAFVKLVQQIKPTHILDTRSWPKSNSATFSWTNIETLQSAATLAKLPQITNVPEMGMPQGMRPKRMETVDTKAYGDYLFEHQQSITDYVDSLGNDAVVLCLTVDPVLERDQREGLQAVIDTLYHEQADLRFETVVGEYNRVPTARTLVQNLQTTVAKERRATISLLQQLKRQEAYGQMPKEVQDRIDKSITYIETQLTA